MKYTILLIMLLSIASAVQVQDMYANNAVVLTEDITLRVIDQSGIYLSLISSSTDSITIEAYRGEDMERISLTRTGGGPKCVFDEVCVQYLRPSRDGAAVQVSEYTDQRQTLPRARFKIQNKEDATALLSVAAALSLILVLWVFMQESTPMAKPKRTKRKAKKKR